MTSVVFSLCLFILSFLLPSSDAAICASQECNDFHICYPFSLGSNKSCEGLPSYRLLCQNGALFINGHNVTDIDYSSKQISVKESDCAMFDNNWTEFLEQVPGANASEVTCDNILIIQWTLDSDPVCKGTKKSNSKTAAVVGISVVVVVVLVLGLGVWVYYWKWKKNEREDSPSSTQLKNLQQIISSHQGRESAKLYSYAEMEKATNSFSADLKLGAGGFGTVYKGTLQNGTVVAIKRSNQTSEQSIDNFVNEVTILSQVNHRNLVKLLGCCAAREGQLLIYEYVSNGTLFDHLHGKLKNGGLSWDIRLQIAVETAEALAYLHSAAYPPIYHRDVKSSNILLDDKFMAKVADFGISRLVPVDATHISTLVRGTPGYLDPEYYETFQLTEKSDVYSFGVVLLELITGQRPIDFNRLNRDANLSIYAIPIIRKGMLLQILDPNLQASINPEILVSIKAVGDFALECLATRREDRPSMKQVLEELLKIKGPSRVGKGGRSHSNSSATAFNLTSHHSSSLLTVMADCDGLIWHQSLYNVTRHC